MPARSTTPSALARRRNGSHLAADAMVDDACEVTKTNKLEAGAEGRKHESAENMLAEPLIAPPPDPHPEASQRTRRRGQSSWLGTQDDVVELRRRPFICKYYIMERPRLRHLWCCHNELGNIWTHILAAALTLLQFSWWARDAVSNSMSLYELGIGLYFLTAIVTFCISVFYHWKMCDKEEVFLRWLYLDQSSCLGVIVVGFFSGVPMGYHCFPFLQRFYVSLSFAVCVLMTMAVRRIPKERWDLIAFVIIGGSGVAYLLPAVHWLIICENGRDAIGFKFMCQILLTLFAAILYTKYIPECFAPGKFDLIGNSHQLWHVAVYFSIALFAECLITVNDKIENGSLCQ